MKNNIWIQSFLSKLMLKQAIKKNKMYDNNEKTLTLIRDLDSQNYIKYINIMHYYIQKLIEDIRLGIK